MCSVVLGLVDVDCRREQYPHLQNVAGLSNVLGTGTGLTSRDCYWSLLVQGVPSYQALLNAWGKLSSQTTLRKERVIFSTQWFISVTIVLKLLH